MSGITWYRKPKIVAMMCIWLEKKQTKKKPVPDVGNESVVWFLFTSSTQEEQQVRF